MEASVCFAAARIHTRQFYALPPYCEQQEESPHPEFMVDCRHHSESINPLLFQVLLSVLELHEQFGAQLSSVDKCLSPARYFIFYLHANCLPYRPEAR